MNIQRDSIFGCILVLEPRDRDGYGRIGRRLAHRVKYEEVHGAIPQGMVVDHLCRRVNCIAIAHLELVTNEENQRRKSWPRRARQKQCKHGHDMSDAMVTKEGGRLCRTCGKGQK